MLQNRLIGGFLACILAGFGLVPNPVGAESTPAAALDNKTCLSCHDGAEGDLAVPGADGEERTLHAVAPERFAGSVHGDMQCVTCHVEITDSVAEHNKAAGVPGPDCVQCHQQLRDTLPGEQFAAGRLPIVLENIESYKTSFHARPNADEPDKPNATCNDCHNVHEFAVPPRDTPERAQWHLGISNLCGTCHEDQLDIWSASVHGREVLEEHNTEAAVCTDCHTTHDIKGTSTDSAKLTIMANCGNCHQDRYASYKATYHGKITTLGYTNTAKCFNCHSGHDIEPSSNPDAPMNVANRLEACQDCHSGRKEVPLATAGFVSFSPHGVTGDFENFPEIWIADQIMKQLLIGTFAFFWIHTLLWFFREFKERRQRRAMPHVKLEGLPELPAALSGKHFRRFSRTWRIAHLLFALSLMILTLTGIPLFYPDAPWAKPLMGLLGGPQVAGIVHRVNAVIFSAVFFWHLIYLGIKIGRVRVLFRIGCDRNLEIADLPQPFDQGHGIGIAARMRHVARPDAFRGIAAQGHDVAHAGLPIVAHDRIDIGARRANTSEVGGRLELRFLCDPLDCRMGTLPRGTARAIGHRDKGRVERRQTADGPPQGFLHVRGLRWKELETHFEGHVTTFIGRRRNARSGVEASQRDTVKPSGRPAGKSRCADSVRPHAINQPSTSAASKPRRRC